MSEVIIAKISQRDKESFMAGITLDAILQDANDIFRDPNLKVKQISLGEIPRDYYWSSKFVLEHPDVWRKPTGTYLLIKNWEEYASIKDFYPEAHKKPSS